MKIDPTILPRDLSENFLPNEGDDIVMIDTNNNLHTGYFRWSGKYFLTHEGTEVNNVKEWKYE